MLSAFCKTTNRNLSFRKVKNWYANLARPSIKQDPPYSHIVQIGDPILRQKADLVPLDKIQSKEIDFLINHLKYVLNKYNCVGVSAPQIGIPLQVCIVEFNGRKKGEFTPEIIKSRKMVDFPLTVFINPVLKAKNYNKIIFTEACESVKGFCADVPRYEEVEVSAFNENGEKIIINADGWIARILQHEIDHLDGKTFIDRMDPKTFSCTFWDAINRNGGKVELPFYPS